MRPRSTRADDAGVGRLVDLAGARAGGHADLGGRARARAEGAARRGVAAPERHDRLDRLDHPLGDASGRQRAEVVGAVVAHGPHDRQPREPLAGELHVGVAAPGPGLAVVAGFESVDQADLEHRGLERAGAHDVVDALHLAEEGADLPPVVAGEVRPDPRSQVGGLADVEGAGTGVAEQVDAGLARQPVGEPELGDLGMTADRGQLQQVVEPEHPEPGGPLEEDVQQVTRWRGRRRAPGGWAGGRGAAGRRACPGGSSGPRRAPAAGRATRCRSTGW